MGAYNIMYLWWHYGLCGGFVHTIIYIGNFVQPLTHCFVVARYNERCFTHTHKRERDKEHLLQGIVLQRDIHTIICTVHFTRVFVQICDRTC